jgi:hypothetical protein
MELLPELEILYPNNSSTIYSKFLSIEIKATAKRGIEKVTYKLNDEIISIEKEYPFNLNMFVEKIKNNENILTIIAEDDIGNRTEKKLFFILDLTKANSNASFVDFDSTVYDDDFPIELKLNFLNKNNIEKIKIVLKNDKNEYSIFEGKAEEKIIFENKNYKKDLYYMTIYLKDNLNERIVDSQKIRIY